MVSGGKTMLVMGGSMIVDEAKSPSSLMLYLCIGLWD